MKFIASRLETMPENEKMKEESKLWSYSEVEESVTNSFWVIEEDWNAAQSQLTALREELATANDKIDKAWNRSHAIDHKGFIHGALDAWKRPVPQHLPYDFSGNPGASATQYCNGWNDAGGYWSGHAADLQLRLADAERRNSDRDAEIVAQVESALRRSFSLGQVYWQQADSDSTCQQNKSDQTLETQAQHILNVLKSISAALKPTEAGASE